MRVVIAEDSLLTREGIVHVLTRAGIEVVALAEDAHGLLSAVATEHPDAAIVDVRMPPTHTDEGVVAAQRILADNPGVAVLVLSQYVDAGYALRLLEEAGCTVEVPPQQTCCGQPAWNSGDDADAASLARQVIAAFEPCDYLVAPSGSCAGTT